MKSSLKLLTLALLMTAGLVVGCTDADRSSWGQYNDPSTVTCYSGGTKVFEDESTGIVEASQTGAGVYFRSKTTGRFVRTYADCIVVSH